MDIINNQEAMMNCLEKSTFSISKVFQTETIKHKLLFNNIAHILKMLCTYKGNKLY